ncbi:MAG: hypothetical protein U5R31_09815 [Acidimicrobiia bacterium]|nr:hypothetical protein [Acidimicrobiia bacterium]
MPSIGPVLAGLVLVAVGSVLVAAALQAPLLDAAAAPGVVVEPSSDDQVVALPDDVDQDTKVWFSTDEPTLDDEPQLAERSSGSEAQYGYVEGSSVEVVDMFADLDGPGRQDVGRHEPYVAGGADGYEASWFLVETTGSSPRWSSGRGGPVASPSPRSRTHRRCMTRGECGSRFFSSSSAWH